MTYKITYNIIKPGTYDVYATAVEYVEADSIVKAQNTWNWDHSDYVMRNEYILTGIEKVEE